jgi:hypothetical protein
MERLFVADYRFAESTKFHVTSSTNAAKANVWAGLRIANGWSVLGNRAAIDSVYLRGPQARERCHGWGSKGIRIFSGQEKSKHTIQKQKEEEYK